MASTLYPMVTITYQTRKKEKKISLLTSFSNPTVTIFEDIPCVRVVSTERQLHTIKQARFSENPYILTINPTFIRIDLEPCEKMITEVHDSSLASDFQRMPWPLKLV